MRSGYYKSLTATTALASLSLAAFTGTRLQVAQAAGPTSPLAGVVDSMGGVAGSLCDIQLTEVADIKAGGPIAAGDPITSDANGLAVKATKLVGQTVYCIGFAQEPAAAGDIFPVLQSPFLIVG